ncbi:acid-sensing ion channel 3-like [Oculina patagonica]
MAGSRDVFTDTEAKKLHPELFLRIHGGNNDQKQNYLEMFGHRIEDMLLPILVFNSCIINDMACGSKNFTAFTTSMHSQCHTFNPGHKDSPVILASAAGHLNGLRLLLNIEKDSYLDNAVSPIVGLRVLVHDQHTFPLIEQFGFAVRPGVRTFCSIKRKKIKNLQIPYSTNCTNRTLYMLQNTGYTYSKPACIMQCLSEFVIQKCGCHPAEYKDAKVPLCAPNDTVLCMLPAILQFGSSEEKVRCEDSCPEPCEYTDYEMSLSYAGLQRNVFIKKLNSFLNKTENGPSSMYEDFKNMSNLEQKEYIDENIVSLDIYFQDLSYNAIEQTPVFESWNLFATLGGYFGLFLGMSILTVLEFVDFAFRRLCSKLSRLTGYSYSVQ